MLHTINNRIFLLMFIIFIGISAFTHISCEKNKKKKVDNAPKVGEIAPTFKLKSLDGKIETDLASFKNIKPVVLFFGSYT